MARAAAIRPRGLTSMPLAAHAAGIAATPVTVRAAAIALRAAMSTDMRVWLDDERPAPEGWTRVLWPDEAIILLKTGTVTEISLDHDLGDDARGTGYDVVLWLEEQVATTAFMPPVITVHSANPSARERMELGIAAIARLVNNRLQ